MRKFYLYLLTFMVLVFFGNVDAFSQPIDKTKKHKPMELKYSGPSGLRKTSESYSGIHHRKRINKTMMKTESDKAIWGYLIYDFSYGEDESFQMGMGTFTLAQPDEFAVEWTSELDVSAGACANDVMYLQDHSLDSPVSFSSIDLITGEENKIKSYDKSTDPCFRDMTYDYTTNTMYGVGCVSGAELSSLYVVNLETGDCTELFPLEFEYWTLAVNNEGSMYGVTTEGNLCRIDVENRSENIIGSTNEYPWYIQSMDFDRSDNTLYWAAYTEDSESFLATINVETGEATRIGSPLGFYAEIVALHVPSKPQSTDTPAAVSELNVAAGEQGALTVKLSWTNPAQTIGGETLTALTKIDIYRNEEIVHTIDSPAVGVGAEWTDHLSENGYVVYKLIASNEEGEGKAVKSKQLYVGKDVPGAVENLVLTKVNETYQTKISWTAPVSSMNGGWFDADGIKYDVVRYPDNKLIGENLEVTTCTDNTITTLNAYSYEIIPKTSEGEGVKAQTNKLFVGPAMSVPYFCDFSTEEARNLWVIDDANGDGCTWEFGHNYKGTKDWFLEYDIYNYDVEPVLQADEWFFSAPFRLEKGRTYTLMFRVRLGGTLAQEKFRTVLCGDADHEAQVKVIGDYTTLNDQDFQPVIAVFDVEETGEYNLGFQCYSDPSQWMIQITDISLESSFIKDMEAIRLKGMTAPIQNESNFYEVTVLNNGAENVSTYRVEVIDEDMNVLGMNNVERELAPQKELFVQVKCTLPQSGTRHLRGRVVLDGDEDTSNDISPEFVVESLPAGNLSWQYVGNAKSVDFSPNYPFVMDMPFSRAQTLYLPADLQFASGKIEKLAYYYYISPVYGMAAQNVKVRISMANTEVGTLLDNYIDDEQFTEVFEGLISIDPQNNILVLDLDSPFEYAGKNLCFLTERIGDAGNTFKGNNFLYTEDNDVIGEGRTRYYFNESIPFGPDVESAVSLRMPNVSILVNGKTVDAIEDIEKEITVSVYPNPATNRLYVEGDYSVAELFTANGMPVVTVNGEKSIDLIGLNRGVYFLKISTKDGVEVHKIMLK